MSLDAETIVTAEMRACIGITTQPVPLPDPISSSDVRRFLEATRDMNPLYTGAAYARRFGYRGRVVPPMLVVQLYRRIGEGPYMGESWPGLVLPEGYTDTRNAGSEIEWLEPVCMDDELTMQSSLVDIYARQGRRALVIYLVSTREMRNQLGELVLRVTATTAKLPTITAEELAARQ